MRTIAKVAAIPLAFAVLCLLACGAICVADVPMHNWQLAQYAAAFQRIKHPPNTSRISFRQRVGLISGNGNHCDYFAGEMRRFAGERQEVEDFYASHKVSGLFVHIVFVEDGEFPEPYGMPWRLEDPEDWLRSPADSLENLYVVHILDGGHEPGWDIRCH